MVAPSSLPTRSVTSTSRTAIEYLALRRELLRELARDSLVRGLISPLIFVWSVGAGLFSIVWWAPPLALSWTAVAIGVGAAMVLTHLKNAEAVRRSLRSIVARQLHLDLLVSDADLRAQLDESVGHLVDLAMRVGAIEEVYGEDAGLRRALAGAQDLLVLHCRAAQEAQLDGGRDCPLGHEVTLELASTAQRLETAFVNGTIDAWFTTRLADEQDEFVAALRDGTRSDESGLDLALAAADPLTSGGLASYADTEYLPAAVQRLGNFLHRGFTRLGSEPGLQALQQLASEYVLLLPVLERKRSADPLAIAHVPALALETYRQGLSGLNDAFELIAAVQSPARGRLESDAAALDLELASPEAAAMDEARLAMKVEALTSHRERLAIMRQCEFRIEELLHHCGRCEASLNRARMELVALKAESSAASVTAVTETLKRTIEEARGVRDELRRLGL
jgi:hypothetical protein